LIDMKTIALAAALAVSCGVALAQAPAPAATASADVPKAKCEPKPAYPGRMAMQSDLRRNAFNRELKAYKDCMMAYVDERKAAYTGNLAAANAAIGEYNETMKKIAAEQEAAKGEAGAQ
jgi:hypothetical protein